MKLMRGLRLMKLVAAGAILVQSGGCVFSDALEFIQTVLLAVTAAGSVAILQNI